MDIIKWHYYDPGIIIFFSSCLGNNKTEQVIMRLSLGLFSQFKNMRVYLYCRVKDYQEQSNHAVPGNTTKSSNQISILLYTSKTKTDTSSV